MNSHVAVLHDWGMSAVHINKTHRHGWRLSCRFRQRNRVVVRLSELFDYGGGCGGAVRGRRRVAAKVDFDVSTAPTATQEKQRASGKGWGVACGRCDDNVNGGTDGGRGHQSEHYKATAPPPESNRQQTKQQVQRTAIKYGKNSRTTPSLQSPPPPTAATPVATRDACQQIPVGLNWTQWHVH